MGSSCLQLSPAVFRDACHLSCLTKNPQTPQTLPAEVVLAMLCCPPRFKIACLTYFLALLCYAPRFSCGIVHLAYPLTLLCSATDEAELLLSMKRSLADMVDDGWFVAVQFTCLEIRRLAAVFVEDQVPAGGLGLVLRERVGVSVLCKHVLLGFNFTNARPSFLSTPSQVLHMPATVAAFWICHLISFYPH